MIMLKMKKPIILAYAMMTMCWGSSITFAAQNDCVESNLVEGEIVVGDSIIGVPFVSDVDSPLEMTKASSPNYATSKEVLQLRYEGYIQFKPSYVTTSTDGNGLQANRQVKQAWIDYRRNDKTVIGGNKYTTKATSKTDSKIYSTSASCWDNLIDWGESGRTYFYRGWIYFS